MICDDVSTNDLDILTPLEHITLNSMIEWMNGWMDG